MDIGPSWRIFSPQFRPMDFCKIGINLVRPRSDSCLVEEKSETGATRSRSPWYDCGTDAALSIKEDHHVCRYRHKYGSHHGRQQPRRLQRPVADEHHEALEWLEIRY